MDYATQAPERNNEYTILIREIGGGRGGDTNCGKNPPMVTWKQGLGWYKVITVFSLGSKGTPGRKKKNTGPS